MFGNAERERLQARIAELETENAALKRQLDTIELTLYKKFFERININIGSVFNNDKETL